MVVADASVVVKWFVEEQDTDTAVSLRDAYINGQIELAAPSLLSYEVLNALRYGDLFDEEELAVVEQSLVEYGLDLVPFRRIDGLGTVAIETDLTVYHAAYLAVAADRNEQLLTTDEELIEAGTQFADVRHLTEFER